VWKCGGRFQRKESVIVLGEAAMRWLKVGVQEAKSSTVVIVGNWWKFRLDESWTTAVPQIWGYDINVSHG
jgi:hypothetical protein